MSTLKQDPRPALLLPARVLAVGALAFVALGALGAAPRALGNDRPATSAVCAAYLLTAQPGFTEDDTRKAIDALPEGSRKTGIRARFESYLKKRADWRESEFERRKAHIEKLQRRRDELVATIKRIDESRERVKQAEAELARINAELAAIAEARAEIRDAEAAMARFEDDGGPALPEPELEPTALVAAEQPVEAPAAADAPAAAEAPAASVAETPEAPEGAADAPAEATAPAAADAPAKARTSKIPSVSITINKKTGKASSDGKFEPAPAPAPEAVGVSFAGTEEITRFLDEARAQLRKVDPETGWNARERLWFYPRNVTKSFLNYTLSWYLGGAGFITTWGKRLIPPLAGLEAHPHGPYLFYVVGSAVLLPALYSMMAQVTADPAFERRWNELKAAAADPERLKAQGPITISSDLEVRPPFVSRMLAWPDELQTSSLTSSGGILGSFRNLMDTAAPSRVVKAQVLADRQAIARGLIRLMKRVWPSSSFAKKTVWLSTDFVLAWDEQQQQPVLTVVASTAADKLK